MTRRDATREELRLDLSDPDWIDDLRKIEGMLLTDSSARIVIDASSAARIGALQAQLLLAARRKTEAEGRGFTIADPTDRVCAALALMGLKEPLLGVPEGRT